MDTKTVRERKRLSDVKEVVEAPPEGLLLASFFSRVVEEVCFMHNCLPSRQESLRRLCSISGSASAFIFSVPSSFHLLSSEKPSSGPCSTFATRPRCTIIWSSLKEFPNNTAECMFIHYSIFVFLLSIVTFI